MSDRSGTVSATQAWPRLTLAAILGLAVALGGGFLAVHGQHLLAPDRPLAPPRLAATAAAVALVVAVWKRPSVGAPLLAALVYLNLSEVLVRHHQMPSILRLLALGLAAVAWRERRLEGIARQATRPLTVVLTLYVLLLWSTTTFARSPQLADAAAWQATRGLAVYVLLLALIRTQADLRRTVWAMVAAGAVLGGLGVGQALSGAFDHQFGGLARVKQAQIYGDVFEPRIAGPLGDPNFFAQILLVLVPLGLCLLWSERRRIPKLVALSATMILVAATVLTFSRGGFLALVVELLLLLLLSRHRLKLAAAAGLLMVVYLVFLPGNLTRRLTTVRQLLPGHQEVLDPDSSFEERRLFTRVAWQIFVDHPLLGVGGGNYTVRFDEYADRVGSPIRAYEGTDPGHYPHNLYLEVAAETGLAGLGLFLAAPLLCFVYLARARSAGRRDGSPVLVGMAIACAVALTGYLTASVFLHGHFQRYLWLLFGLAAAVESVAQGRDDSEAAGAGKSDDA